MNPFIDDLVPISQVIKYGDVMSDYTDNEAMRIFLRATGALEKRCEAAGSSLLD